MADNLQKRGFEDGVVLDGLVRQDGVHHEIADGSHHGHRDIVLAQPENQTHILASQQVDLLRAVGQGDQRLDVDLLEGLPRVVLERQQQQFLVIILDETQAA